MDSRQFLEQYWQIHLEKILLKRGCGWSKQGNSWGAGGSLHIWESLKTMVIETFHMAPPLSPALYRPCFTSHLPAADQNSQAFSKAETGKGEPNASPLGDGGQRFPFHSIHRGPGAFNPIALALQNNSGHCEIGTHTFWWEYKLFNLSGGQIW